MEDAINKKQYSRLLSSDLQKEKEKLQVLTRALMTVTEQSYILETILENTNTHIAFLNNRFDFIMVNSIYAISWGYSRQELVGKNYFSIFPDKEKKAIFEKVKESGDPVQFRDSQFQFSNKPNTSVTYWDWTIVPVKTSSGKVDGLVISMMDNTERKHKEQLLEIKEEALKQSESNYRRLIEFSPDAIIDVSTDGNILDCNQMLCKLTGYSKKQIQGKHITEYVKNIVPEDWREYCETMLDNKIEGEMEILSRDGQLLPFWAKALGVYNPRGDLNRIIVYARNIAERKKLEQLKDDFIGLVSHELRTPLTVIIGCLNTVISAGQHLDLSENIQLLKDASIEADSLSLMLENLLELSRARVKDITLNHELASIVDITQRVVDKMKLQTTKHKFAFSFPDKLPLLRADPVRLQLILYNLLDNAVKYSPDGGEIKISVVQEFNNLIVKIADQGIGLSNHEKSIIFDQFSGFNPSYKKDKGTSIGLGLMVCRKLIEAHGGTIWVESEQGKGSVFYFMLPLV